MIAKEPWEEKCTGRNDLISAWCVVVIMLVVMLIALGMVRVPPCQPNVAMADRSASLGLSHTLAIADPEPRSQEGGGCERRA